VGTILLLIHFKYPVLGVDRLGDEPLLIDFHSVGIITLYLALVMSVFSAIDYFRHFVRAIQARAKPPSGGPAGTGGPAAAGHSLAPGPQGGSPSGSIAGTEGGGGA
jgi:hypothetical protein